MWVCVKDSNARYGGSDDCRDGGNGKGASLMEVNDGDSMVDNEAVLCETLSSSVALHHVLIVLLVLLALLLLLLKLLL